MKPVSALLAAQRRAVRTHEAQSCWSPIAGPAETVALVAAYLGSAHRGSPGLPLKTPVTTALGIWRHRKSATARLAITLRQRQWADIRGAREQQRGVLVRCCGRAGTVGAMKRDSRVVYSTTDGDLRKARDSKLKERQADGNRVKVRREVAGRRGKAVTTVSGVPVDDAELKELAGKLKKRCGVGGSVKGGVIEMQGDHRDVVVEILKAEGYLPVLAGG
jgi:translation initiation factor 1